MASSSDRLTRVEEQIKALFRLLDEKEKQLNIAFTASQKATDTALAAQNQVNATQNEFRGALKDQAATLATSSEVDRLLERIVTLEKANAGGLGRQSGISAAQALIIALIPIALALFAIFWKS